MNTASTDRFAELRAPTHWQAVEFISDLHLQFQEPATFEAWRAFLSRPAGLRADALFILGDLFELWIGDDMLRAPGGTAESGFALRCANLLHQYSQHTPVYFMCGNRDFLLGADALKACGMSGLHDPTVLDLLGQRWLLSHGDALCLDDVDYMRFRAQVRNPDWQTEFLRQPLEQRQSSARAMRERSEANKQARGHDPAAWADVDAGAARRWLAAANASTLIHGHTHRPAEHDLGQGHRRAVLSDWDASATPPRAEWLRLDASGLHRLSL
jgi:UDP-2,3-diacylglucosamine hydrolase